MSIHPKSLIPNHGRPPCELDGYPPEVWAVELNGRRSSLSPAEAEIASDLISDLRRKDLNSYTWISMALEGYGFRIVVITKEVWRVLMPATAAILQTMEQMRSK